MLNSEVVNGGTNRRTHSAPHRKCGLFVLCSLVLTSALTSVLLGSVPATAQSRDQASSDRKLITRIEPDYPDALKRLFIGGAVRVEVVVAPSGAVKSTTLLGGSPILGQSTMKAIKQWKYAPAPAEETLTVKIEFDPYR